LDFFFIVVGVIIYFIVYRKNESTNLNSRNIELIKTYNSFTRNEKIAIIMLLTIITKKSIEKRTKEIYISQLIKLFTLSEIEIKNAMKIDVLSYTEFIQFNLINIVGLKKKLLMCIATDLVFKAGVPNEFDYEITITAFNNFAYIDEDSFIKFSKEQKALAQLLKK
jgi:heme/copper-type cytochrome/quinol oxidase subunit 2